MQNPSTTSVIEVQQLTKSFGERLALRGIDLQVKQGECLAIFGPNGAGKTTLIKILSTIMNPSSGRVYINDMDVKNNPEECRHQIGVVTHHTFLYGNLTARENLEFYCRMYDVPRADERIREVAEQVQMSTRLHDRVFTLSRGMQQRISIARSLLHNPSIMLLDEPETGLDQQAMATFWEVLRFEGNKRRTVVLTSHNLERGLELSDRLLIISRGKIAYQEQSSGLNLAGLREAYQYCTKVGK